MDRNEGVSRILEFLESGFDMETGLRFQVAKGGELSGAGSLRAILLDWLGQVDPEAAAKVAMSELVASGTSLDPEVYVIHMRNYAWGTSADNQAGFLRQHLHQLMDNDAWINNPTPSIGEAMDVAVYLQDISFVPYLADLAMPRRNPNIQHAAKLALERLMEVDPSGTAGIIIDDLPVSSMNARTRASLLSRLDPADTPARVLLGDYLASPQVTPDEVDLFLNYLPNLNISYSYNLLSPEIPITQSVSHTDRMVHTLESIAAWQADPRFSQYRQLLEDREHSLRIQLYGNPGQ
jgi:hypothetical protein